MIEFLHCIRSKTVTLQETERFQEAIDSYTDLVWEKCTDDVYRILSDLTMETQIAKSMLQSGHTYKDDDFCEILSEIDDLICEYLYQCHTDLMAVDHMRHQVNRFFESGKLAQYALLGDSIAEVEQDGEKVPVYQSVWLNEDGKKMLACVSMLDGSSDMQSFQFLRDPLPQPPRTFTICS